VGKTGRMAMAKKSNTQRMYYQIVVRGQLESTWCQWFDGMDIQNLPKGKAVLTGFIVDQAMLHGLLIKIRDLGLPLISVNNVSFKHGERKAR
jgi:hypothetical protein